MNKWSVKICFLLLVAAFNNSYCQKAYKKDLGIGIVVLDFGSTASYYRNVQFYYDSNSVFKSFVLHGWDGTDSVPLVMFDNLDAPPKLYFRCMDSTKTMYHIAANDSTGLLLWVRKDTGNDFLSWFNYFKGFDGIEYNAKELRSCPGDTCPLADKSVSLGNTARIHQMLGDWIQIETKSYSNLEDDLPAPHRIIGWIRWRKDNTLFVNGYNNE